MKWLSLGFFWLLVFGVSACTPLSELLPLNSQVATPQRQVATPIPVPLEPCTLVETARLAELVGQELQPPQPSRVLSEKGIHKQSCLWLAASDSFSPSISISLIRGTAGESEPTETEGTAGADINPIEQYWQTRWRIDETKPRYEVIPDLAEQAYWSSTEVYITQNGYIATILVSMPDPKMNRDISIKIGQEIAQKLLTN